MAAAPPAVSSTPRRGQPADPAEGAFIVEPVQRAGPPAVPKLEIQSVEAFSKGHPPKPDGWMRWDPEIQGPPGKLEEPDQLFQLAGPPGGNEQKEESEQERLEIRKKILENQVKPGEFQQMVPTAPIGPDTVLPICPPAAALEKVPVLVMAKPPAANPALYYAPGPSGEEFWTGWSLSGTLPLRFSLTVIAPEAEMSAPRSVAFQASTAQAAAKVAGSGPMVAKAPVVDAPRNYKAAEALKSAAQTVAVASKVDVRPADTAAQTAP